MSVKPPFIPSEIQAAVKRLRDRENLVQILPGVLMSEDSFAEMLAEDQRPEDLFRFLWDSGYGLEDTMRGDWSAEEREKHSLVVARASMLYLFRSRATRSWKSGYCILVQRMDGVVDYPAVKGNEIAPEPIPADGRAPEFLSAFAAAEKEARHILASFGFKPRAALLLFASRVRDGVAIRYQSLTENAAIIRSQEEELLHADHG
jgi:hypothetical protein